GSGGQYNNGSTGAGGSSSGSGNIIPLDVQNTSGKSELSVVSDGSGYSTYVGLGSGSINATYGSAVSLNVTNSALGSTAGNTTLLSDQYAASTTSNVVHLVTADYRTSAGSDWTTDAILLQRVTDVSGQQYIAFAPNGASVCINTVTCTHTFGVSGTIGASGAITASTTPDISETIPASDDVSPADVVSAGPDGNVDAVRSSTPYDPTAIGVISDGTSSFKINSNGGSESADPTGKYLVLAGRVPVHVTDEGGAIHPGDYLTTSSTPGYAMKATQAGPVIGTALAAFDGTSGTVMVQTHLSYYAGPTGADVVQNGGNATLSSLTVSGSADFADLNASGTATINNLTVTGSASIGGNLSVGGTLHVTGVAQFDGGITVGGHIITAGQTPAVQVAPAAGTGATCTVSGNDTGGSITIVTGSGSLTDGTECTLTFHDGYSQPPNPVISPRNKDSAQAQPFVDADTGKMTIQFTQTPATGTTYRFNYFNTQ
ncbi:MAG: hypothetical protein ACREJM_08825, partial [Candidatus Saccharimonadales bacterium]